LAGTNKVGIASFMQRENFMLLPKSNLFFKAVIPAQAGISTNTSAVADYKRYLED